MPLCGESNSKQNESRIVLRTSISSSSICLETPRVQWCSVNSTGNRRTKLTFAVCG
jgi:hypothetical protein